MSDRSVRYRLGEETFIAAALAYHRAAMSSRNRWLIIFLVLALAVMIQLWRDDDLGDVPLVIICLLLVAGLAALVEWLVQRWLIPARMRRYYRQTKRSDEEVELSWDDEAIHFRSVRGESHTPMADWFAWTRTPEVLLLYENDALYYAVPAEALGSDGVNDLTTLLTAAGAREKR